MNFEIILFFYQGKEIESVALQLLMYSEFCPSNVI